MGSPVSRAGHPVSSSCESSPVPKADRVPGSELVGHTWHHCSEVLGGPCFASLHRADFNGRSSELYLPCGVF